jgi:hypothetical protein
MVRTRDPEEIQARRSRMIQNESTASGVSRTPRRNSEWMQRQRLAGQEREDDIGMMGERRRTLESNEYARGGQGSLEKYGGLPRVVLLTPEGGQLINIGICRGFVFSVISRETAARYAMHRSKLSGPIMVTGPAGQQVRAIEHCAIAFPQEKAQVPRPPSLKNYFRSVLSQATWSNRSSPINSPIQNFLLHNFNI